VEQEQDHRAGTREKEWIPGECACDRKTASSGRKKKQNKDDDGDGGGWKGWKEKEERQMAMCALSVFVVCWMLVVSVAK